MSAKAKQQPVRIVNPVGRRRYTSPRAAAQMVARGIAAWVDGSRSAIELDETHYAIRAGMMIEAKLVRRGESGGMAGLEAVQGLPVAGPAIRVFTGHRPDTPIVDYSVIEVSRRLLPPT